MNILIRFGLFLLIFLYGMNLIAQDSLKTAPVPRALLSTTDSIYVLVDAQGQKSTIHFVKKGETLYSIAKFYSVSYADLKIFNEDLEGANLKIGQKIKVPLSSSRIHIREGIPPKDSFYIPVIYAVKPGETLFRISRVYFRMSTDLLKKNNLRQNDNLSLGDELLVGWFNLSGIKNPISDEEISSPPPRVRKKLRQIFSEQKQLKEEVREAGVAFWNTEEKYKSSRNHFVLHRLAAENSVIRIFNPMTNRVIYAKVVGKIPESQYDDSIIVVLTPSSAHALGAIDPRFHVKVQYLK